MSNCWKDLESRVAKSLNGRRMSRGNDFNQSMPDVEHPQLSIECKYRKGELVVIRLKDFQDLFGRIKSL